MFRTSDATRIPVSRSNKSKVKVTRPINADKHRAQYLPNANDVIECSFDQSRWTLTTTTQAWKQTSGAPSGQTRNYRGITLLYIFTTALLYTVSLVTMATIVAMLWNTYLLNRKD